MITSWPVSNLHYRNVPCWQMVDFPEGHMDLLLVTYALKHRYCFAALNQWRQSNLSCVILYQFLFSSSSRLFFSPQCMIVIKISRSRFVLFTKELFFQEGGPIGLVQSGDVITIDVSKRVIDVDLTEQQLEERRRKWTPPPYKSTRGALWKVL